MADPDYKEGIAGAAGSPRQVPANFEDVALVEEIVDEVRAPLVELLYLTDPIEGAPGEEVSIDTSLENKGPDQIDGCSGRVSIHGLRAEDLTWVMPGFWGEGSDESASWSDDVVSGRAVGTYGTDHGGFPLQPESKYETTNLLTVAGGAAGSYTATTAILGPDGSTLSAVDWTLVLKEAEAP